ncbi:MAG: hypothetical protein CM1200mP38_2200 [Dehalococcoidia bacterium]|nr:MAG: hypothetical protein CM1200mP38_2200 [Dehalococcoidia bacterium]
MIVRLWYGNLRETLILWSRLRGHQLPYIDKVEMTLTEDRELIQVQAAAGAIDSSIATLGQTSIQHSRLTKRSQV